jgi:uncharacterized protein (DUF488 family)
MIIHTIGHSTRTLDEFLDLLRENHIDTLIDIRSFPGSRKFPHFGKGAMERSLPERGFGYLHVPELGGYRKTQRTSDPARNAGWNNLSFRHYADYTRHPDFMRGLNFLRERAEYQSVCIMCSERHPCQCHRSIVSDYLDFRGDRVVHILAAGQTQDHVRGKWGAKPVDDGELLRYPASVTNEVT